MSEVHELDKIALSVKSRKLLKKLLKENEKLEEIMVNAQNEVDEQTLMEAMAGSA